MSGASNASSKILLTCDCLILYAWVLSVIESFFRF
jgi:hypothetical protein